MPDQPITRVDFFRRMPTGSSTAYVQPPSPDSGEPTGNSTPTESARHVAELTAALKRIDWQGGTDCGSQWLAGKLYDDGIRVQLPPYEHGPQSEPIRPTGRQGRGA